MRHLYQHTLGLPGRRPHHPVSDPLAALHAPFANHWMVDVGGPEQPVPAGGAGAGALGHQVPFEIVEQSPTQAASVSHPATDGHTAATWFAHVLPGCIDRKQQAPFAVSVLSALSRPRRNRGFSWGTRP